jgi:flagellin FlaB
MTNKSNRVLRDERGITALETAIILIAFVVVAAVFAFTILQAGTFSTERGREAIYGGLEQVSSSMEVMGTLIAQKHPTNNQVMTLTFELQAVAAGGGVNITDTTSSDNVVVIAYGDDDEYVDKLEWSMEWIVGGHATGGDGDAMLEPGEIAKITINLSDTDNNVTLAQATEFVLEVKPPQGSVIPILRTTPASLDDVMWLYH